METRVKEETIETKAEFQKRLRESRIDISYDPAFDLLFVTIGQPQEAITEEVRERVHLRFDPDSNKVVGLVVTSFKKGFLRDNPEFKKYFETVFDPDRRLETWGFPPRSEPSKRVSGALSELVKA